LVKWLAPHGGAPVFYSIMDYYTGKQPDFERAMLRHAYVETYAPRCIKYVWGHHQYFLFEPR
jgi:hypothetical protein